MSNNSPTDLKNNAQLSLPLRLRDEASFSNFFVGEQINLVHHVQVTAQGQGETFIYLWGAASVGRTHLLQASCHLAQEQGLTSMYLPLAEDLPPDILQGMEDLNLVCLDDLNLKMGDSFWEEALFHFYNKAKHSGTRLIITSSMAPLHLNIQLADLRSRLASGLCFQVKELTEAEKIAAMQLRAELRGMNLSQEVGEFLLKQVSRDMQTLIQYLDKLDEASFAAQRRLTIPFIKSALSL